MRTVAPAKINWTLEVLGKQSDGYHEIRSVMQTIDLCDELTADKSDRPIFETSAGKPLADDDLIVRAARALEARVGRELPARIRVEKRLPLASGLGGGSSDAAATLRLLNQLHRIGLSAEDLAAVGAEVGSDVPFFVYGGTALVEGRGERVTPLPDVPETWLVLIAPPIRLPDKTKRMYEALEEGDFSDGSRTATLSQGLGEGKAVRAEDLSNAFERVVYSVFDGLENYRDALLSAGALGVHLAGAGPGLYALADGEVGAMAKRVQPPNANLFVARTIGAEKAIALTD